MHAICWILIVYRCMKLEVTKYKQIAYGIGAFIFLLVVDMKNLVFSQFTSLAGIIAFTALLWFVMEKEKTKFKKYIIPIILLSRAFMIRYMMAFMYLPFFALFGVFQLLREYSKNKNRETIKKLVRVYFMICVSIVIFFGTIFAIDKNAYSTNEWKIYKKFNVTRSELYDYYDIPPYESNEEFYSQLGIQKEEMYVFNSLNFSFSDKIDGEILSELLVRSKEIRMEYKKSYSINKLVIQTYVQNLFPKSWYTIALYFAYGMLFAVVLLKKDKLLEYQIIFLLGLRSVVLIYLIYIGRYLDRVTYPLVLAEIASVFGCFLLHIKTQEKQEKIKISLIGIAKKALVVGMGTFLCFSIYKNNLDSNLSISSSNEWMPNVFAYVEGYPGNNYLFDVYTLIPMKGAQFVETTSSPSNFLYLGGWLSKASIYEEKIRNQLEDKSIEEAFALQDNVFLIQKKKYSIEEIANYIGFKNNNVDLEIVDNMMCFEEEAFSVIGVKKE